MYFGHGWKIGKRKHKKNDCVAEAQLLAKYKGLVFCDPDSEKSFFDLGAKYGVPPGER